MIRRHALPAACAGLLGLSATFAAHADADEAWLHRAELPPGLEPALVLLLDTSQAASRTVATASYEPSRDYSALVPAAERCDPARVYWRRGPGPAPDCAQQSGLDFGGDRPERAFQCEAARAALAQYGYFVAARAAQWRGAAGWGSLGEAATGAVECRADRGRHGAVAGAWYAADGAASPWSNEAASEVRWDRPPLADPYIFYLGNFLNYLRTAPPGRDVPIAELAQRRLADALSATDGLEAALMRFTGADGGYVAQAVAPALEIAAHIESMTDTPVSTEAPLAELLAEAAAWLGGGTARFGRIPGADPRAFEAGGGRYRSPYSHACLPVTLAVVTAGDPSGDDLAADAAASLPDFAGITGGCSPDCLAALTRYLQSGDLLGGMPGRQSAPLSWIAPSSRAGLIGSAVPGGAVSAIEDPLAYVNLIARTHQHDAAVPAGPALSAAGLVQATSAGHEPAVIYALTAPRARERWLGNLFRYGLGAPDSPVAPPVAVDRDGEPALDPRTGLPWPGTRSLWSQAPDADLLAGGASGQLPVAAARRAFSDLVTSELTDPRNRLAPENPLIDHALVGLGVRDAASPSDAIEWLLASRPIGDPGTHAAVVVSYRPDDQDLAFVATQDGLLHAFDAASGVERWAWMPRALLPRLAALWRDEPTTARSHGIDGPLVAHRFEPDGDGRIEADAGEHLWLLFGPGRSGGAYHALDIADPDAPRLLWSHDPRAGDLQSSSEPVVARLATGGSGQSAGNWVVLLAAGRTLQMLDAATGQLLWNAAQDGDLDVPELTAALASAPRLLDLDADGQLDRAYLLDEAGGLWRFDFTPRTSPADLATARRIARLGSGRQRFQASPDISIAVIGGRPEIAIAAGSGRVDRPRDATEVDRVYVVFDRGAARELTEPDLHDATDPGATMPPGSPGWYFRLDRHGAGEKTVGPSVTFDHVLRFQTYQPLPNRDGEPCGPPRATHRLYARDVRNGQPASNVQRQEEEEEPTELDAPGLPVELRFAFPASTDARCPGCRARPFGLAGARTFDAGYAGDPVKTSWRELPPAPDSR